MRKFISHLTRKDKPAPGPPIRKDLTENHTSRGFLQFRILIIGKANAGKTTILEKVCETKDKPIVRNRDGMEIAASTLESPTAMRGHHDIENEIKYPTRPDFVFHDSRGIEAGSMEELETLREFIARRSTDPVSNRRLHAIWYCLPTDNARPLSKAEMALFESGTGSVPVIAIFTKSDALDMKAFNELREKGMSRSDAKRDMVGGAEKILKENFLDRLKAKEYPPAGYVCLRNMDMPTATCDELIRQTLDALNDDALMQLLLSARQAKAETSIIYALTRSILRSYVFGESQTRLTREGIKKFILTICQWFPHTWSSYTTQDQRFDHHYRIIQQTTQPIHPLKFVNSLHKTLSPMFTSLVGPLTVIQVVQLGMVVLTITAHTLFYDNPERAIDEAIQDYNISSTKDVILTAVESVINQFGNGVGLDDVGKEGLTNALIQVIKNNKLEKTY